MCVYNSSRVIQFIVVRDLPEEVHEIDMIARHIEAEQRSSCTGWVNIEQYDLPAYHFSQCDRRAICRQKEWIRDGGKDRIILALC